MTSRENCSSLFCQTWRAVFKMFARLFRIEQVKASRKVKQELFINKKTRKRRDQLRTVPTIVTAHTVLRIARYSGFLWVVPTNTRIFLRGLKLYGESRTYQMPLVSQKKIWGNHAFFREN